RSTSNCNAAIWRNDFGLELRVLHETTWSSRVCHALAKRPGSTSREAPSDGILSFGACGKRCLFNRTDRWRGNESVRFVNPYAVERIEERFSTVSPYD